MNVECFNCQSDLEVLEIGVLWCPVCGAALVGGDELQNGAERHLPEWSEDDLGGLTESIVSLRNEVERNRNDILETMNEIEENLDAVPSDRLTNLARCVGRLRGLIGPECEHPSETEVIDAEAPEESLESLCPADQTPDAPNASGGRTEAPSFVDSPECISPPDRCVHDNPPGECDACDRLGDQAYDSWREDRFFGGRL